MTDTANISGDPALRAAELDARARTRSWWTIAAIVGILVYLAASFYQFDLGSIARKWNPQNASLFVLDSYAHKDHVTMRWSRPDNLRIAFEGGYREVYQTPPKWMTERADGGRVANFHHGGKIVFYRDRVTMEDWPDTPGTFVFRRQQAKNPDGSLRKDNRGQPYYVPHIEGYETPEQIATLPEWMRVTENKVEIRPTLYERLQVFGSKVEAHRYEIGWKYFWFDFNSPLEGYSVAEAVSSMFSNERIDPNQSNASLVLNEFLDNDQWQHGDVLFSLLETVLMALIGTLIACLVGLPLAFMAASNVTPLSGLRFILRRLFDFLRGVDMLIWSLIFLRAFGPGLFTGIFAIAFTDTGTMGKLMSEAIENADNKQREGIQSTGASKAQQNRFGIVPQILPVFISQSLYYLESNTRGAVIIGAMGAGGIGLKFLGALQTGSDWENVAYMALLVLLTVIVMDTFSAWLRRALIGLNENETTVQNPRAAAAAAAT